MDYEQIIQTCKGMLVGERLTFTLDTPPSSWEEDMIATMNINKSGDVAISLHREGREVEVHRFR